MILDKRNLKDEFSKLVLGFADTLGDTNLVRFIGTKVSIASDKEVTGGPCPYVAIEIHKILTVDTSWKVTFLVTLYFLPYNILVRLRI